MVEKSTANNKERNGVTLRKKHSSAEILILDAALLGARNIS